MRAQFAAIAAHAQDDGAAPPAEGGEGDAPPIEEVTAAPESEEAAPADAVLDAPPAEEATEAPATEEPAADELPPDEPTAVDVPAGEVVVMSDDTFDAVSGQVSRAPAMLCATPRPKRAGPARHAAWPWWGSGRSTPHVHPAQPAPQELTARAS